MPLSYHPDFYNAIAPLLPAMASQPKPALHDIETRRARVETRLSVLFTAFPMPEDVEVTEHTIKSYDGTEIRVRQMTKKQEGNTPGPALLHTHGGGMIIRSFDIFVTPYAALVSRSGTTIFQVDYRVAPEDPFPTPIEDAYAALTWLYSNASRFNIDPNRIGVMGESAGGGLATGIALMARDRGLNPPLAKQILFYPMLDDRTTYPQPAMEQLVLWSVEDNITAWTAYLGADVIGTDKVSPYAAPAREKNLTGLPSTYIDTGELDIFRDDDMAYAQRLMADENGKGVEFHLYPRVPHLFEILAPDIDLTKRATANRVAAMSSF